MKVFYGSFTASYVRAERLIDFDFNAQYLLNQESTMVLSSA